MSINFYDLFELAQIKAIAVALEPSLESRWRIRCRSYSEMFHTPLHMVMDLDPMFVLQALAESKYPPSIVEGELEELLDLLNKAKDPTYSRLTAQETEDLVDAVMNKELSRISKKKVPTQETIQSEIIADTKKNTLKKGGISFTDLESLESKSESSKSGFKD